MFKHHDFFRLKVMPWVEQDFLLTRFAEAHSRIVNSLNGIQVDTRNVVGLEAEKNRRRVNPIALQLTHRLTTQHFG
ncbi:Recombinational DNA repair protein [Pseudomonas syringae pv. actinidiae]|uniref:Recombinational DNA repair protein n=1 Tax=Pseudomonas syringae pv. actinidiae TaxID=103796 RepID=A0AAN4TNQ9_PSESF|nr:Recombinational DNA repair protein [Pseudomonas syringae pv. actinidiae]